MDANHPAEAQQGETRDEVVIDSLVFVSVAFFRRRVQPYCVHGWMCLVGRGYLLFRVVSFGISALLHAQTSAG